MTRLKKSRRLNGTSFMFTLLVNTIMRKVNMKLMVHRTVLMVRTCMTMVKFGTRIDVACIYEGIYDVLRWSFGGRTCFVLLRDVVGA